MTTSQWRNGDIVISDRTGNLAQVTVDGFGIVTFHAYEPIVMLYTNDIPDDVRLLARVVDGKRLPVVELSDGELFAVRSA